MALSNSFDFTVTAADVVQGALEKLNVLEAGESVDADDQALALRELNKLVKQWGHPADGSQGMPVWLRKLVYLFLAKGTRVYTIGPSQDRAAQTYTRTTISAAEAAGQTVISITNGASIATGAIIGIVLDDGTLHWSTVTSGGSATPTINDALASAAAAGNTVFYYTPVSGAGNSIVFRPTRVLTAVLRDVNNVDQPVDVYDRMELPVFEGVGDKTTQADPLAIFVEHLYQTARITLDCAAQDVTKVLRMWVLSPVDDIDASTDSLNFPPEWTPALEWELAKRCAPSFRAPWAEVMQANWQQATAIARSANPRGFEGGFHAEDGAEDEMTL